MYGFDQIIVSLWFLPVTLFIALPLALAGIWGALSLLAGPFRQKDSPPLVNLAAPELSS